MVFQAILALEAFPMRLAVRVDVLMTEEEIGKAEATVRAGVGLLACVHMWGASREVPVGKMEAAFRTAVGLLACVLVLVDGQQLGASELTLAAGC